MTAVGFTLQPEARFLDLLEPVLREEPDYYEVAPETLWRSNGAGSLEPNAFHAAFRALKQASGRPFVAHGVAFSLGSVDPDPVRRAAFLERIRADHAAFEFGWYTDHLGTTSAAECELTLPMPLPASPAAAAVLARNLSALQSVVPDVGVENSVFYFHFGDPLDEPFLLEAATRAPRTHILLDLHNVHTTALNVGFDPWDYLLRLPLERVIELHLAGGADSPPSWLGGAQSLRLDSHDHAVPEQVWRLFERVLPLCPNLRGVTLERMEGTVEPHDVPLLREELRRIRRGLEACHVA